MKQGTINIDCGDETCDGCRFLFFYNAKPSICLLYNLSNLNYRDSKDIRCQRCLETFKDNIDNPETK